MKPERGSVITMIVAALVISTVTGCTVKATTKTTSDGVMNFLSSTSGKSWWTEDGLVAPHLKAQAFVAMNGENLAQDMARGEGEYLASLGSLLGVAPEHEAAFQARAQEQYRVLVSAGPTTPDALIAALQVR